MIRIGQWRERLSSWQDTTRGRMILTVVFVVVGVATLGPLCWSSFEYSALRDRIAVVLSEANIAQRNPIAMQLIERGTVTVDGVEIGSVRIQAASDQMFARDGRIGEVGYVSSFVASAVAPNWAPINVVERPWLVSGIAASLIALAVLAVWVGMAIQSIVITLATSLLMAIFWRSSQLDWVVAVAGIGFLILLFQLLMRVTLALMSSSNPVFGIAHTVLLESLRQRISIGFIGILLVVLPLIPLWIERREPLRYQVQTFISRGSGLVFVVAAFLTLFLSCSTVAFEIRDRQIWSVLTKPVSRWQYLAGKLFGISVLNGIVLIVGSFAVFLNVQMISTRAAVDIQDAIAVPNQVLVAREVARPQYRVMGADELRTIVNDQIERDSLLRQEIADGIRAEADVAREIRTRTTSEFMSSQRTIEAGTSRAFEFSGLQDASHSGSQPVLRYLFHIGNDSSHDTFPVLISFGELPPQQVNYVPVQRNVLQIPAEAISKDGTLVVTILNGGIGRDGQFYPAQWAMNFDADGLEVLHRIGGFEANYFRAILIDWGKLVFIAALGVASASVLSFPVAVLLAFSIFLAGSMSPFLALSLENYTISPDSNGAVQVFQYMIRSVVGVIRWGLAPFGASGGSAELVDGRAIPWSAVAVTVGQIGIGWSMLVFAVGLILFRKKEIAIYSGGDG